MKKLVIVNHLGEIVREVDVFLEGQDTELTWATPTAIWLGRIIICDPKSLEPCSGPKIRDFQCVVVSGPEPTWEEIDEHEAKVLEGVESELEPVKEVDEDYEAAVADLHPTFSEEVTPDDAETASDSSAGDEGVSEAEQSPSAEDIPEKPTRRKTTKRSK